MNFALDGLVGFDLHGKTVGVIGTGRIGAIFARICLGFGCRVLIFDLVPNPALLQLGATLTPLDRLYAEADVISLHVPLTPDTHHLLDTAAFARIKPGAILVNTSRGGLIDTRALIDALKNGQLGAAALDVYEEEEGLFFRDLSDRVLTDDVLARLMTFPNVIMTAHQGFLTREALDAIAATTADNIDAFARGVSPLPNSV
jgi:D-lactate dehydrogenase